MSEELGPSGSRTRKYCELGLSAIRIIKDEGWQSFFRKARNRIWKRNVNKFVHPKFSSSFEKSPLKLKQLLNTIEFPIPTEKPEVSIVIPAYNKWQYTGNCLYSIFKNTEADYEVIVVDDASTDKTKEILSTIKNLRFVKNEKNSGFVDTCNYGAKVSKGNYILFLNNDTMVTSNWLQPLLAAIKEADVGAVGSKLVYPNGTLQEAGGIIWRDGSGWNYGRGDNPEKPEYNYVREVDYCTGACLLVKKDLFEKLGGFDVRFRPGYYEETDLCFSIRKLGYKVMYQPMSKVVHFEGITNGTDTSAGIKKYQEINRSTFVEKWNNILQKYHYNSNPDNLMQALDKRSGKRILIIDHYVPAYDKDAGSLRMFSILKILSEIDQKVTFIGDNLLRMEPYTQELQQDGVEVLYSPYIRSVEDYIKNNGQSFEVVVLSRPHVAIKFIDIVKTTCKTAQIIYDTVDLVFLREFRRAKLENSAKLFEVAKTSKKVELYLAQNSDLTLVVSPVEKELLVNEVSSLKVQVLSLVYRVTEPKKDFHERRNILFVGGFDHLPNIDAVQFFVDQILPLIIRKIPDLKFYIVGSNPPSRVLSLRSDNVVVTGFIKDLSPYFEDCRVFVAPLRYGAGVKGKVNQSMSYGLPVVTTTIGAEGIGLTDGKDALIADEPEEFARKIEIIYKNEELWNKLSQNSIEVIEKNYSPEVIKEILKKILI
jgi:O-antigen biosynthesis protein